MKILLFFYSILLSLVLVVSCTQKSENPFFTQWNTPFGVPPFDRIKEDHYMTAFKEGMRYHKKEVEVISENPEKATFQNTIEILDESGTLLTKVSEVFYGVQSAHTNDQIQAIAKEVAPLYSQHTDDILLNNKLFQRVKTIYEQRKKLTLSPEENMLLEKTYQQFVRGGANLDIEKKEKLREINKELSVLSVQFEENILKENNAFELVIDNQEDLIGLPDHVISAAAEAASEREHEGKWVFTLHKPSMIPFLQYSEKRNLREKIFKGYINKGNNNDELDNKKIVAKMISLRVRRAKLLGYKTHSHYVLEEAMAKKPENVYRLLHQLWEPALKRAKEEARSFQEMIDDEGNDYKLEPWDWWYYAEKVKTAKYDLNEEMLKPYFQLESVLEGLFTIANKLYGITFEERSDLPIYHPDVRTFEVKESDGTHIGVLYMDFFPRESKNSGAWMGSYRKQHGLGEQKVTPVITNVCNFPKPTGKQPSLLSFENVETLFHEFGHGLHGLLSDCKYYMLSGTSVPRDFVELPSQIMENWVSEPEALKLFAKHYKTGDVIPQELIDKIQNSSLFNQGFETVEYLAASILDMDWHTLTDTVKIDVLEFEKRSLEKINLIPEIVTRYRTPYFKHIFSWGYSSGYYSYIWSEWLDADGFEAFKENGLFDQKTATAFRKNILEKGNSEDPMTLYKRFRGREPKIEPLLKKRGLI